MKPVSRDEIVDYQTYEEIRNDSQKQVFAAKARRRIHVGEYFTFLFENALTVRYQVQEMMRAEKIVKERAIRYELDTYNSLLGGEGELGCALLIEITDPSERVDKLRRWLRLPEQIYVRMPDGTTIRPTYDRSQIGWDRLSSVQYLKFKVGRVAPLAIGIDLPGIEAEKSLSPDQREALGEDLTS